MRSLQAEMVTCGSYGIPLVVSHVGATVGEDTESCAKRAVGKIKSILEDSPDEVTLLMENTAGQGRALNSRLEDLAKLLDMAGGHRRLGVCLDTCHLFAAGYDIRTPESFEEILDGFDVLIGLSNLRAIHLNDSKKPLGSRIDRHENIGKGEIGLQAFGLWVNDPRLEDIPMVIETPIQDRGHENDLAALNSLRI
jgi:deoxyribonuclease-4